MSTKNELPDPQKTRVVLAPEETRERRSRRITFGIVGLIVLFAIWGGMSYFSMTANGGGGDTAAEVDPVSPLVGWVTIMTDDGAAYEVWQDSQARGYTTIELSQPPEDTVLYEVRTVGDSTVCSASISVRLYEEACLLCTSDSVQLTRVACDQR